MVQYLQTICYLGGWNTINRWSEIYHYRGDRMFRLEKALNHYIKELPRYRSEIQFSGGEATVMPRVTYGAKTRLI